MPKYVVLYRFTEAGAKNIRGTVERAKATRAENERRGFKIESLHWTQGPYDMVALIDAPSEEAMMGAMANIVSAGNVSSTTLRAFDEREMAKVLKQASGSTRATARRAAPRKRAAAATTRRRARK